jgi:hypothetical protein
LSFLSRAFAIAHGEKGVSAALRCIARFEDIFAAMEVAPQPDSKGDDGDAFGERCGLWLCLIALKVLVITHVCSSP